MEKHNNNVQDCDKLKDLYTSYIYGDTSPEEERIISEHLKVCQKCANDVVSLRETIDLLKMEPELTIPQHLIDNFESKIYKRLAMEAFISPARNMRYNRFREAVLAIVGRFTPRHLSHLEMRPLLIQSATVAVLLIASIIIGFYGLFNNQHEQPYSSISYPSAHKRIEQYNQKELHQQWEDAVLSLYVEGDDWDAAGKFMRIREENPGTSLASMADKELNKTNVDLIYAAY